MVWKPARGVGPRNREPLADEDLALLQAEVREVIEGGDAPTRRRCCNRWSTRSRIVSRTEIYPSFSLPAVRPPTGSAPRAGFEPAAFRLGGGCSVLLSYRGVGSPLSRA